MGNDALQVPTGLDFDRARLQTECQLNHNMIFDSQSGLQSSPLYAFPAALDAENRQPQTPM